jgi:hypothetical protein
LAHIFAYPSKGIVQIMNDHTKAQMPDGKEYAIKCVYPGYAGEYYENLKAGKDISVGAQISETNFIRVTENGEVITYIDRIFDNIDAIKKYIENDKLVIDKNVPYTIIENLYKKHKEKKGKCINRNTEIKMIVDKLMDSSLETLDSSLETL